VRRIILALALVAGTDALAATALSPEGIAQDIEANGAKAVVDRLWNSGDYDRLLDHIDKGTSAWVALAPKLAAGTDAGSSEGLTIALAYALPRNPEAVLAVLDPKNAVLKPDMVCGAPFIEDTVKDMPRYIKRAKAAVSRVKVRSLEENKAACLAALAKVPQQTGANHK
jgi:hypothetical protein